MGFKAGNASGEKNYYRLVFRAAERAIEAVGEDRIKKYLFGVE